MNQIKNRLNAVNAHQKTLEKGNNKKTKEINAETSICPMRPKKKKHKCCRS